MLSRFFGKGDKPADASPKEAGDTRGLEVVEDDPDTAWSMWDSALAEQDSRSFSAAAAPAAKAVSPNGNAAMPPVNTPSQTPARVEPEAATQPMELQQKTLEQRKNDALEMVELHHRRIANTIRTLWGYKECGVYINKLIMSGGDGMGHARVGFNQEAVEAMLVLSDIHDAEFGPPENSGGLGLSI
jgi:hypothetical protein